MPPSESTVGIAEATVRRLRRTSCRIASIPDLLENKFPTITRQGIPERDQNKMSDSSHPRSQKRVEVDNPYLRSLALCGGNLTTTNSGSSKKTHFSTHLKHQNHFFYHERVFPDFHFPPPKPPSPSFTVVNKVARRAPILPRTVGIVKCLVLVQHFQDFTVRGRHSLSRLVELPTLLVVVP